MDSSVLLFGVFTAFILVLLALDLGVLHRERRAIPVSEALIMVAGYVTLALMFNISIYFFGEIYGYTTEEKGQRALEFLTGYFIEYALSMDNIMVFVLILAHFRVPPEYQMRVLVWGIIGALVLRALFIYAGAALIEQFHWIIIVFGIFLIFTGIKTLFSGDEEHDLENNAIVKFSRRLMRVTPRYHGDRFFTRENGILFATPLFLVLIVLNLTDILFAVDSIPAIFAITRDPFIVYTSNVFAILGLRALYFALAGMLHQFKFLKIGISLVLVLIGTKMVVNDIYGGKFIPTEYALLATAVLIFGSVLLSVLHNRMYGVETAGPKGWIPGSPSEEETARTRDV
jgi:tellurite resistance protein TerC